jgi:hypothetical protein
VKPDDLISDTRTRIWLRLARNPDGLDAKNPAGYCVQVMKNLIRDALQGQRREHLTDIDPRVDQPFVADVDGDDSSIDQLRIALEDLAEPPVWVTAAALNYVTLAAHPAVDIRGAPTPRAGANPDQARMWPALWFAGQRDGLFPTTQPDAAQRKRLNRAAGKVNNVLRQAAATMPTVTS